MWQGNILWVLCVYSKMYTLRQRHKHTTNNNSHTPNNKTTPPTEPTTTPTTVFTYQVRCIVRSDFGGCFTPDGIAHCQKKKEQNNNSAAFSKSLSFLNATKECKPGTIETLNSQTLPALCARSRKSCQLAGGRLVTWQYLEVEKHRTIVKWANTTKNILSNTIDPVTTTVQDIDERVISICWLARCQRCYNPHAASTRTENCRWFSFRWPPRHLWGRGTLHRFLPTQPVLLCRRSRNNKSVDQSSLETKNRYWHKCWHKCWRKCCNNEVSEQDM